MVEATEIVFLVAREGQNPEEAGSRAAQIVQKATTTLSQQPGYLRSYWGNRVEDPASFVWTIDWEDVQLHKDWINAPGYKPFIAPLAEAFDFEAGPPFFYHVNFTSDSVPAREAPVTEFASFNISTSASASDKSQLEDNVLKVAQFTEGSNAKGNTVGWAIEEIDAPNGKVNPLQLLIGWDSVDDHMKARELPDFGPLVAPVRAACSPPKDGKQGMAMFHVKLRKGEA